MCQALPSQVWGLVTVVGERLNPKERPQHFILVINYALLVDVALVRSQTTVTNPTTINLGSYSCN